MSGALLLRSSLRCQQCHRRTLDAFASVAGISLNTSRPATRHTIPTRLARTPMVSTMRTMSTRSDTENDKSLAAEESTLEEVREESEVEELESEPLSSKSTSTTQDSAMPWYLQDSQPVRQYSPIAERQKLPDLPENAPDKLQPMLETLQNTIGLDDLRLIDLRQLDPPAALGANLIMLFGTARSERHLHTSADRFCRWLRSTYKLQPYADGLLGRNELKVKLRRKAKRAKLLGGKGLPMSEFDDGLRTGWICVNVGEVEKGRELGADELQQRGIVGFSDGVSGAHVVVQMLTEEKREELDLEKLWGDALARQTRRSQRLGDARSESFEAESSNQAATTAATAA